MTELQADSGTTRALLDDIRGGADAFGRLFARHRDSLRRMIDARLDRALRQRLDGSDLIQETQIEALRRIADYLREPDIPFRLWLRQIAQDRLVMARRRHFGAARRAVGREAAHEHEPLATRAVDFLLASTSSPSQVASRNELARHARQAIARLSEPDREILEMRLAEGLSNQEAADVLQIEPNASTKRYGRALLRLRAALAESGLEGSQ